MTVEQFEQHVMAGLLAGNDPLLDALRKQYAAATVRDRETTANGFITRFEVPATAPSIERKLLHLDDLQVELAGTKSPVDASLHVFNGRLKSLECFLYEGAFPSEPEIRAAWYYGTQKYPGITPELMDERDLEELLEEDE
ncbi:MAG TPA: hypothetical protein VNI54_02700 [Thermoanaerobaculia bacterium]|nr:hypothetical protein [Thermoanaerobaculia bacterium]